MIGFRILDLVRIAYSEKNRFILGCTDNFPFQQIKMITIIIFSQSFEFYSFQIDIKQVRCFI